MTDTTDIKALRVEIAELRLVIAKGYDTFIPETKIQIKLLERILDQLEAERQRADEFSRRLKIAGGRNLKISADNSRFNAELAALKGDQVPVAFTAARWLDTRCKLSVWTDRESAVMEIGDNSKVAELYDRPQKPVVLPQAYGLDCFDQLVERNDEDGFLFYKCEVIDAIEAASGLVKDGE